MKSIGISQNVFEMGKLFKTKLKMNCSNSLEESTIRVFQKNNRIIIPLDYVNILLKTNGIKFEQQVYFDNLPELCWFREILSIEGLKSALPYFWNNEELVSSMLRENFLPFGGFWDTGPILLFGINDDNANQVWYYNFTNSESLVYISKNIYSLIENHLQVRDDSKIKEKYNL